MPHYVVTTEEEVHQQMRGRHGWRAWAVVRLPRKIGRHVKVTPETTSVDSNAIRSLLKHEAQSTIKSPRWTARVGPPLAPGPAMRSCALV